MLTSPKGLGDWEGAEVVSVNGEDFDEEYGENNRPGESSPSGYIIAPGGNDDLAWAKYAVDQFEILRPVNYELMIGSVIAPGGNDDLPLNCYIGLYDFTMACWDWHGPYEEPASILLNSQEIRTRYVNQFGKFFYYIVTDSSDIVPTPENPEGLTAVEIVVSETVCTEDYYPTAPHYTVLAESGHMVSADPDPSQKVTLHWVHIEDNSNPENEAKEYKVFRENLDDPFDPSPVPDYLGKVKAPITTFIDPDNVEPGVKWVTPGATYIYYLQSKNNCGETGLTASEPISVPLLPPTDLEASDGVYANMIRLEWTAAYGAETYEIYRDNQVVPIATVDGDYETYDDTDVHDHEVHTYWLKSINEFGESDYSEPDTGYLLDS